MTNETLITQIQRFSVNDGPGFRTNIFLKGCNLKCSWCHNPETQSTDKEIYWKKRLCVQCGECLGACPLEAINPPIDPASAQEEGSTYYKIIKSRCDNCMECVEVCSYGALEAVGQAMTVEEILKEVESDMLFYKNSDGGMTISGGEPTQHKNFALKLMEAGKERGIHICLDTSGHCQWADLYALARNAEVILYDLKHLDDAIHRKLTGVSNKLILENLIHLVEIGTEIWLRIIVIPEHSISLDYHRRCIELLKSLPGEVKRIDIIPFHNWCEDKYGWLGRNWPMGELESVDPSDIQPILDHYLEAGLNATIGGSGFEKAKQIA